jgi:predicted RNA-binding protein with PUA-like domain
MPSYWIVKSEPSTYSYADLAKEGRTEWTGIRNFAARNHLRAMKKGDLALFFHTGDEKAVVGVAKVVAEASADPTAPKGEDWSKVDLAPVKPFAEAVPLSTLKKTKALGEMAMLKQSRLSVSPVTKDELALIAKLGKTKV